MTSKTMHQYPAIPLSAAWRVLGDKTVDALRQMHAAGQLLPELEKFAHEKEAPAWDGDAAYKLSDSARERIENIGRTAAAATKNGATWGEEQRVSAELYEILKDLPVSAQEDSEFWLYVTCILLLPLLLAHAPVEKPARKGKLAGKHVGTPKQVGDDSGDIVRKEQRANDILAKRMYLRGRIAAASADAGSKPSYTPMHSASETESSHVLTGRTARQPRYAAMLIKKINKRKPSQDELRSIVAKVLNVEKATKVVETLDETELAKLFANSDLK